MKRTILHKVALSLALLAVPSNAMAASCLTTEEVEGLMTFSLPVVIEGLRTQCAGTLPATAPLIQAGPLIAARYQVEADLAWPVAKTAFDKMSGIKLGGLLGQSATRSLIQSAVSDGITKDVKTDDCPLIDRIVDILQPLPPRNMAMLLSTLISIGDRKKAKPGPLPICPQEKVQ